VCGNLDPATYWVQGSPAEMQSAVLNLLAATKAHRNFVVSSGCDVPPKTPLANVDAFFAALREANG
jgi:uroporphyrinogen decarboxylase